MISFYRRTITDVIIRPGWWVRVFQSRHPGIFLIVAIAATTAVAVFQPAPAHALVVENPVMPAGFSDSFGIELRNYTVLPIDTGGLTDPVKAMVSGLTQFLWMVHLALVTWMLWLCDWLLKFEWVNVVSVPLTALASLFQEFLTRLNFIPFALAVTGAVAGLAIFLGKIGSGILELVLSALCATLAVTTLANPVASIVAVDGGLQTAREWGGGLAVMVTANSLEDPYPSAEGTDLLADSVTGQLGTLLVRIPAQTIAFGNTLPVSCDEVYYDKMVNSPPATDANVLKDAIRSGDCFEDKGHAESVKKFNENINFAAPIGVLFMIIGSIVMFVLPLALAVLLFLAVMGTLVAALRLMGAVYVGVLPGMRGALWRSSGDTLMGLASIALMCVALAAALKVLVEMLLGLNALGIGLIPVSIVSALMIAILVIVMIRVRAGTLKAGTVMALAASRWGLGSGGLPEPTNLGRTVLSAAGRTATGLYAAKQLLTRPHTAGPQHSPSTSPSPSHEPSRLDQPEPQQQQQPEPQQQQPEPTPGR